MDRARCHRCFKLGHRARDCTSAWSSPRNVYRGPGVLADLDPPRTGPPGPYPLADMDPPGPYPLADLDPRGPYPLADLDPPPRIWTP